MRGNRTPWDMDTIMEQFVIDQQWVTQDGKRQGKVVEITDDGVSGVVETVDENGTRATFRGTAEAFQGLPEQWRAVA